jgi:AcrR family transcriptional regulator
MIQSAAALIATRGLSATSFSDVLEASGAPRGSIYHHFPEGKVQLAEDAIRWTSDRVLAHLQAGTEPTPAGVLGRFVGMWRRVVLASNGASGCSVAGVALDESVGEGPLMDVVRTIFRSWVDMLARQLEATGVPSERAGAIAIATLASMEGALILCRAEGGTGALDTVERELLRLLPAQNEK